jgi:hypothetical protein
MKFYADALADQAKRDAKTGSCAANRRFPQDLRVTIFFSCQLLNRICTTGPQVFHSVGNVPDLRERTRVECNIA